MCTDFVNVGLGLNSLIHSKIDKVLSVDVDLALRINDCQLTTCDECDPLLDADGSTTCKFSRRGISSGAGAVAAQSIHHSGLLHSSTEK